MKIEICRRWHRDTGINGPDACMACPDEMNGINYGWVKIDNLKIRINLCDDCLDKFNLSCKKAGIKK